MDSETKDEVEREAQVEPAVSSSESSVRSPESFRSEDARPKIEDLKPKTENRITLPKLNLPRIEIKSDVMRKIINTLKEYKRVLLITKKPDMEEFKTTVKASALGITIIGVVGFIIAIIAQLLTT